MNGGLFSRVGRGSFATGLACLIAIGTVAVPQGASAMSSEEATSRHIAANWATENYSHIALLGASECTYFVSSALWQAGLPTSREWNWETDDAALRGGNRTLHRLAGAKSPTIAATSADDFKNYMVESGLGSITQVSWSDNTAGGARLGDVIAYDWNGHPDGIIDHVAIVTSLTSEGYPYVTQRTPARKDRFWSWDPSSNKWIENSMAKDGIKPNVYLIRINY